MQRWVNNWDTVLSAPLSAAGEQLEVPLAAAERLELAGGDYYLLTLAELDAEGVEVAWEVVRVTAVDGDALTIERGEEGTDAQEWPAGARIQARLTAETLARLQATQFDPDVILTDGHSVLIGAEGHVLTQE
ncbi:MAG: hypothetical protein JJU06_05725 [Ectothiorhodospiraceae bacterium]|nr:hypothetical protein [Ectothiorhodospiraceae bacterium]MCH8502926.1 hypothetical protein [Ectothiorhodospiraceae bacterium]